MKKTNFFRKIFIKNFWLFLGIAFIGFFIIGILGFKNYDGSLKCYEIVYRTFQLVKMESGLYGEDTADLNIFLNISRFGLPLIAAFAILKTLLAIFTEQLNSFRIRRQKRHIIICGLGDKGARLAEIFLNEGYNVVAIEIEESNNSIEFIKQLGGLVLIGDATQEEVLLKAGIKKASDLIANLGNDSANAEVAAQAYMACKDKRSNQIRCFIDIIDPNLFEILQEREIEMKSSEFFRMEFYNTYFSTAKHLIREYPPEIDSGEKVPHILIVGFGAMGQNILLQVARYYKDNYAHNGEKLFKATVIDKMADRKVPVFLKKVSAFNAICNLRTIQMDIESEEFLDARFIYDDNGHPIDYIYMCVDDDTQSLNSALILNRITRLLEIPIFVRMSRREGLSRLINMENNYGKESLIIPFGLIDKTCSLKILSGMYEQLAEAAHNDWLESQIRDGVTIKEKPTMVEWSKLPEHLKESNRQFACSIGDKLEEIECIIVPLDDWDNCNFEFTENEIEIMAKMEHERFWEERKRMGWRYGDIRDDEKRIHPDLVDWEKLPDKIREIDREMVQSIPRYLARIGKKLKRKKCD